LNKNLIQNVFAHKNGDRFPIFEIFEQAIRHPYFIEHQSHSPFTLW